MVSATDAEDVQLAGALRKISLTENGFTLHGDGLETSLSKTNPGGAALIGLRWDGQTLRPFSLDIKKPAVLVWGAKGPIGIFWLRDGAGSVGLSAAELSSFLQQTIAKSALRLVDDSYRPDDIPTPNQRFARAWQAAGGDAADSRALVHAVMLRSLQQSGVLASQLGKLPDLDKPLGNYPILQRGWVKPETGRILTWGAALLALVAIGLSPLHPLSTMLGFAAGMAALVHGLRTVGTWLRLKARPHSKIRSAAMGAVRIRGEALAAMSLVSPMRGLRAIYYKTKHEKRGSKGGWQSVSVQESPNLPFYLRDETGRVLIDTLGAEWNGLEVYTHEISNQERVREWVFADGIHTEIFGTASADPGAPVVSALREGLNALFLSETASQFDINHDGVISPAEQKIALQALEEHLRADRDNVTVNGGVYVGHARGEPLVISSHSALPLGLLRGAAAAAWVVAGFAFFLAAFVYPEQVSTVLRVIITQ